MTARGRADTLTEMASFVLHGVLAALLAGAAPAPPLAAPGAPAAAAPVPTDLKAAIDKILAAPQLARATIGVVVIDTATGAVLYEHDADAPINPASNVKLVTTAAALALLGPEHRYVTRLEIAKDTRKGGVIAGDLFLRGGGDPALVTADLYELASLLYARGITQIDGAVVVDGTAFDRDELPPGYDQKSELAAYRALSGAASVNFNTFVVHVQPGSVGQPAVASIEPPAPSLRIRASIKTIAGARDQIKASRAATADGATEIVLTGTIGAKIDGLSLRYPVDDPSRYAGEVLVQVLADRGIKVASGVKIGAAPADASPIATHRSEPLAALIRGVNKLSNNFMAEQILKSLDLAAPATFAGAVARVRDHLTAHGITDVGIKLTNGSGLYDTNRLSARQIATLLHRVGQDFRIAPDFIASLPIMGVDGTLQTRLRGSPVARYVRAKTGTLNQASALSGYAGAEGKPPLAFAILIGDIDRGTVRAARLAQDQIAEELARAAAARG